MSEKKEEKKLKSEASSKQRQTSKENPEQKKKVEAELEAESSSEEEEVKVSRVGYVEMRIKKKNGKPFIVSSLVVLFTIIRALRIPSQKDLSI